MKHCTYCGKEYPDELEKCPIDGNHLQRTGEVPETGGSAEARDIMSPEEKSFWERMTLKEVAILLIRFQAVWFLFNAAIDATYLPRYLDFGATNPPIPKCPEEPSLICS